MWAWWAVSAAASSVTRIDVRVEHVESKPQLEVAVTGEPCPEAELEVRLDGVPLEPVSVPTTCEIQQKINKRWWRLAYAGPAPRPGPHTVEVVTGDGEPLTVAFTQPSRPEAPLPKKITEAGMTLRSAVPLTGQLAMRPAANCMTMFKAPVRGAAPPYALDFVPKACSGRGEVSARLNAALDATCGGVACSVEAVWMWTLGEVAFDLDPATP